MGLFKPKWEHKDPKKRMKGVAEKLNDQAILERIAAQDPYLEVRLEAVKKIDNELFLAQLCNALQNDKIWYESLKRINNQEIIASLALVTQWTGLASRCLERLSSYTNQTMWEAMVFQGKTDKVQQEGLRKITKTAAIDKVAKEHPNESRRCEAIDKCKNKALLRDVIQGKVAATERAVRMAKVSFVKLADTSDEELLCELALEKKADYNTPKIAIEKVESTPLLIRLYEELGSMTHRSNVLRKIQSAPYLEGLLQKENTTFSEKMIAYKNLPYYEAQIEECLKKLNGGNYADRVRAAKRLPELLENNQKSAFFFWNDSKVRADEPHTDTNPHIDNGVSRTRSGDCTHDDFHRHTDTGLGVVFPPYPFED